jgi:four helix bundle protein
MEKENQNIIAVKSYDFALEIIQLYKRLVETEKEYILSKQVLRSGTSIGANVREANSGVSKKDFVNKFSIALKEARETDYWLSLISKSGYLKNDNLNFLIQKCNEIIRILSSIILTTRERYLKDKIPREKKSKFRKHS